MFIKDTSCFYTWFLFCPVQMKGKITALWQNFDVPEIWVPEIACCVEELTFFGVRLQSKLWLCCFHLSDWVDHSTFPNFSLLICGDKCTYLLTEVIYLKHLTVTYKDWLYATIIILWPLFSSIFLAFLLSVSFSFKILVSSRLHILSQLQTLFFLIWLKLNIYMLTFLNLCAFKTFFLHMEQQKEILCYSCM